MTTKQVVAALDGAVYDVKESIDELLVKAEDLEFENQGLRSNLDDAEGDLEHCQERAQDLVDKLR